MKRKNKHAKAEKHLASQSLKTIHRSALEELSSKELENVLGGNIIGDFGHKISEKWRSYDSAEQLKIIGGFIASSIIIGLGIAFRKEIRVHVSNGVNRVFKKTHETEPAVITGSSIEDRHIQSLCNEGDNKKISYNDRPEKAGFPGYWIFDLGLPSEVKDNNSVKANGVKEVLATNCFGEKYIMPEPGYERWKHWTAFLFTKFEKTKENLANQKEYVLTDDLYNEWINWTKSIKRERSTSGKLIINEFQDEFENKLGFREYNMSKESYYNLWGDDENPT